MDGFKAGLNGYFDVKDGLSRYLRRRADQQFAAERAEKRAVGSRTAFEERRERIRSEFLSSIGGLPDRPEHLPAEKRGALARDGYTVELLAFESLPDFHVTANCYIPEGDGPHPGVLVCCGHIEPAKADPLTQQACIELALNGFVVLAFDPVCQGERAQYRDPETGETLVSGGGGVFAHCYAGQQCFYAGSNLARYMVHDARRALDVLCERPDVDDGRIGVIGASGDGIQSQYLALLDDRIDAAAPCCAVTERKEWLKTGKRIDAEQLLYGAIPRTINYDDFLAAMVPRPVCIGAAASDEYFPLEGVYETVARVRRVYDLYDAVDHVSLVVADEPHCSVYELGDSIFEWLCKHLSDAEYISHDPEPVDEYALRCTSTGSVRGAYADERTIAELVRGYVTETYPNVGQRPEIDDSEGYANRVRKRLIEKFALDRRSCELYPRYVDRGNSDGLTTRHVFFKTERNPDVVVTGVLVSDPEVHTGPPVVALYDEGTEALFERSGDVASLAGECGTVLVFDPRGVGAVRNREIPIPNWVEDYYGIYGTEFKLAYDALLLGESLFGMRVYDVLRAVEFLRSVTDSERITLTGEGAGAYHALYAGVVDSNTSIDVSGLGPGFGEMATTREFQFDPRLTVFDIIGDCDVSHLLTAFGDRIIEDVAC